MPRPTDPPNYSALTPAHAADLRVAREMIDLLREERDAARASLTLMREERDAARAIADPLAFLCDHEFLRDQREAIGEHLKAASVGLRCHGHIEVADRAYAIARRLIRP